MTLVYFDRYDYAVRSIDQKTLDQEFDGDPNEFLRVNENLAPEANLENAFGRVEEKDSSFSFSAHNCAVGMDLADAPCQCGAHC